MQVPLFQHMDDLVLENICDRVKSLIFPKGEVVSATTNQHGWFGFPLMSAN